MRLRSLQTSIIRFSIIGLGGLLSCTNESKSPELNDPLLEADVSDEMSNQGIEASLSAESAKSAGTDSAAVVMQVRKVIRQHQSELRDCFLERIAEEPEAKGVAGRFMVAFVVDPASGLVTSTEIQEENSTLKDSPLRACVLKALSSWDFRPLASDQRVEVTYPFEFELIAP